MKTIPFNEALEFLKEAHDVSMVETACTTVHFFVSERDDTFLTVVADNDEGLTWEWTFSRDNNECVQVDGDTMTLIADADDDNDATPQQLRLYVPMQFD